MTKDLKKTKKLHSFLHLDYPLYLLINKSLIARKNAVLKFNIFASFARVVLALLALLLIILYCFQTTLQKERI